MDVDLRGTNRTLLMPLWGRAKATRANGRILRDPKAVELAARLGLDVEEFDRVLHPSNELFTIARARALDDIVRAFLARHPEATVVNLGAGLDTGFHRVDNGRVRWFDVDLPQVIELRRRFIPETERSRCLAASLLEAGWVAEVAPGAKGLLFLASGVLAYFRPAEVGKLLCSLGQAAPGGEMAFDVQSCMTNFFGNRRLQAAQMGDARFQWAAHSSRPVLALCRDIEVLEEFGIFARLSMDDFPDRDGWRMARMMDRLHTMTVIHVRFRT